MTTGNLIAETFRSVLAEAGPRQGEVLRRCAIPRWWDVDVLAVLRERADGNEHVFDMLAEYSFVRPLPNGRYAYSDEVRAAVQDEWQTSRSAELQTIHRRLAEHFDGRVAAARSHHEREYSSDTPMMRTTGDWVLWQREAIYHWLRADAAEGSARLRAAFDQAEATFQLAEAEAVLQLAVDAPLDAAGRRWLRFMRGRLNAAALRLDAAEQTFVELLAEPEIDPALGAAVRRALADVLAETGQWAHAIELYRATLAHFTQAGDERAAAEVMLRLGEAYYALGINTGGWYVPAFSQNDTARRIGQMWYAVLSLPFLFVGRLLRHTPWSLPLPIYLASYQNWLLTRLYRTAQAWYDRAHDAFKALGDDVGLLRAERQRTEIVLLFGHRAVALQRIEELLAQPAARDPYHMLLLRTDRAVALLELGRRAEALATLDETLRGFRALGDFRGEAAVLALQGRAAADADAVDEALQRYASSLDRFRALRYTAARELVLYALRAWQRRVGPGEVSQRINALLAQEPEKRYVARFPRSLLAPLQVIVLGIVPLTMLLASVASPQQIAERLGSSRIVELQTTYNLWSALASLVIICVLAIAIYTAVALALIFFMPLEALEREQPDVIVSDPQTIARYDFHGALANRLEWSSIHRWLAIKRVLWRRPLSLLSLTFLEDTTGNDLRIDGITGWYGSLQGDIGLHLRAAGNATPEQDQGIVILRSVWGVLLAASTALLTLCIAAENGWASWFPALVGSQIYAVFNVLAFSGSLSLVALAYLFATQPLAVARLLQLRDWYPWAIGLAGLGAVALYLVSGGTALPVQALNVGTFIWGAYVLANAIYTLFFPRLRAAGVALMILAVLGSAGLSLPRASALYNNALGRTYAKQLDGEIPVEGAPAASPAVDAARSATWSRLGNSLYEQKRYADAVEAYTQALNLLANEEDTPENRRILAQALLGRAQARRQMNDAQWQTDAQAACRIAPEECQRLSQ